MKIRNGYISNSSSSSYIVNKDLSQFGISCIKLTKEQMMLIHDNPTNNIINFANYDVDCYLTQFVYSDSQYEEIKKVEHILYQEGQMNCEPREEDLYNEYASEFGYSVYILKQHDIAKKMTLNEFVKEYKKTDLPKQFLIKYEKDGIKLKYIW